MIIDAHLHADCRPVEDFKNMKIAGVNAIVSCAYDPLEMKKSNVSFEHFDRIINREAKRVENEGVYKFSIGENEYEIDDSFVTFETAEEQIKGERFVPHVIEPSYGIDRIIYSTLLHSFTEDVSEEGETRSYFKLPAKIAPIKVAVLPLVNKEPLTEIAQNIETTLRENSFITSYDTSGTIGRRYARADEIGVPFAVTVDYDSIEDNKVTIRDRDTFKQKRVAINRLPLIINQLIEEHILFEDIEEWG